MEVLGKNYLRNYANTKKNAEKSAVSRIRIKYSISIEIYESIVQMSNEITEEMVDSALKGMVENGRGRKKKRRRPE